jgi:thiamine kinase-like enzyme
MEFLESSEIQDLLTRFNPKDRPFTFAHNDCHYKNILFNRETGTSQLVDYETGGSNCIYYDLSNIILFYMN